MALLLANRTHATSIVSMDTIVTAKVISPEPEREVELGLSRALGWFGEVERVCSRFDPDSEVSRLACQAGRPVEVSPLLLEALCFSMEVARASRGAFDPTVGAAQAKRGFDRNFRTGEHVAGPVADRTVTYEDVVLDAGQRTVTLRQPLLLDLGAVAKGMAIDLAAKELDRFESFCIDAGGDLYVKGRNEQGYPWSVGIVHPRQRGLVATVRVPDGAVCTSGDYERPRVGFDGEHHLLDPRSGASPRQAVSCTVLAPTAMAADALSTAAFVLGPQAGVRLLEDQGLDGLLVDQDLRLWTTSGFERWLS